MVKQLEKLTSLFVRKSDKPGRYGDGGNLYLQITPVGNKSWVFRYKIGNKTTILGLGATHTVSLAEARAKARHLRQQLIDGINPSQARQARKTITFSDACAQYIAQKKK